MGNNELFMQEYKNVENTLRNKYGMTYLELEGRIATTDMKSKMQVCRILRNYIAHESDCAQFISISPAQILFLNQLNCYLTQSGGFK